MKRYIELSLSNKGFLLFTSFKKIESRAKVLYSVSTSAARARRDAAGSSRGRRAAPARAARPPACGRVRRAPPPRSGTRNEWSMQDEEPVVESILKKYPVDTFFKVTKVQTATVIQQYSDATRP